jgi:molybdate-binding protein
MVAGLHLFDPDSGDFNLPALAASLVGPTLTRAGVVLIEWAWRQQGLVVAAGNPRGITGLQDLKAAGIAVMRRQAEAGSHLLLAHLLAQVGLGFDDLEVVAETARGETDLGLAILEGRDEAGLAVEAAARALKLGFVPLMRERYDLLLARRDYFEEPLQKLFAFARGEAFLARAAQMGGYDVSGLGTVHYNGA